MDARRVRLGHHALLTAAVLAAVVTPALAERVEFPITTVRTIASDEGLARILLDPGDISVLDGELVMSAFLDIPLPARSLTEPVDVVIFAVGSEWVSRSATWRSPWAEEGGDLDDTYAHTLRLEGSREAGTLSVDVSQMVRDMADGVAGKNGFLLTVPVARRDGFRNPELAVLGNLSGVKLRVTYRAISKLGYRHGSLSVGKE